MTGTEPRELAEPVVLNFKNAREEVVPLGYPAPRRGSEASDEHGISSSTLTASGERALVLQEVTAAGDGEG
jgi:hypothetical protein